MSPINVRNISHPELDISLHLSYFSKEVSPLTDWQTYMNFTSIWIYCTNTQGMSPKSFIQFHQEGRQILGVQVICPQTDIETDRPAPRGDPTRGGSPKNGKFSTGYILVEWQTCIFKIVMEITFQSSVPGPGNMSRVFSFWMHISLNLWLNIYLKKIISCQKICSKRS